MCKQTVSSNVYTADWDQAATAVEGPATGSACSGELSTAAEVLATGAAAGPVFLRFLRMPAASVAVDGNARAPSATALRTAWTVSRPCSMN